jgi:hypothetical protein
LSSQQTLFSYSRDHAWNLAVIHQDGDRKEEIRLNTFLYQINNYNEPELLTIHDFSSASKFHEDPFLHNENEKEKATD